MEASDGHSGRAPCDYERTKVGPRLWMPQLMVVVHQGKMELSDRCPVEEADHSKELGSQRQKESLVEWYCASDEGVGGGF
jgi:hypothetical protein